MAYISLRASLGMARHRPVISNIHQSMRITIIDIGTYSSFMSGRSLSMKASMLGTKKCPLDQ